MDDINFDELDQAVNSALQKSPENETSRKDALEPEEPIVTETTRSTPIIPKRRGQFMDLVHPSSDMTSPVQQRVNRQASPVQPFNNPASLESSSDEGASATSEVGTSDTSEQLSTQDNLSRWPDPIDFGGQNTNVEKPEIAEPVLDDAVQSVEQEHQTQDVANDSEPENSETQTTPFIKGTEVEKRPLGAFAEASPAEALQEPSEQSSQVAESADYVQESESSEQPIELSPEVVSVEDDVANETEASLEEQQPEQVVTELPPSETSGGDIPQQYLPAHEDSVQVASPVFDTNEYHQPLIPPKKQKHTGLIVFVMLLLLALLGAAAWYVIFVAKLV